MLRGGRKSRSSLFQADSTGCTERASTRSIACCEPLAVRRTRSGVEGGCVRCTAVAEVVAVMGRFSQRFFVISVWQKLQRNNDAGVD